VLLVVSRGIGERAVPDVAGQNKHYARLVLSEEGYELGDVVRVPSTTVPRNIVVASDPGAGEILSPGSRVSLLVSNGPPRAVWVMPDLTGQDPTLVADKLRFAGFPVVVEGGDQPFRYAPQRIRGTYPPPGHPVAEGDTIRIYSRR
jgi:serine/threonine-protein kinase